MSGTQRDVERLIAHIRDSQQRECAQILAAARDEAARVVSGAYREASRRLHTSIVAERELLAREQQLAAARLHTAQREHAQQRQQLLLESAMQALEGELLARWRDPVACAEWLRRIIGQALELLPHSGWCIVRGPLWDEAHVAALQAVLEAAKIAGVQADTDDTIRAGLRIHAGGVVLDATLDGLLRDRKVQEQLLAELFAANAELSDTI